MDLGVATSFNRWIVKSSFPRNADYELQTSTNGVTYTTIAYPEAKVINNLGNQSSMTLTGNVTARYVRVLFTKNIENDNNSSSQVAEFELKLIPTYPPTLITNVPTLIATTSVTLGGQVTDDGETLVTERGIVYATGINPTTANTKVKIGDNLGSFSKSITGLTPNTTYYTRAYAINNQGTAYGTNEIKTVVKTQDGTTTKTYTVIVNRAPSSDANLSALTISSGTLSPTFGSSTTSYSANVPNEVSGIKVNPTVSQSDALIEARVNGGTYTILTSGASSSSLPLNVGSNTIEVNVTAQDGGTLKTYTVSVTRADILSVALNNYTAKLQSNGTVLLNWDTFSETKNDYFEVLRSVDGLSFIVLETIKGNGTSNQRNQYSFLDKYPQAGNNYYKLVQSDLDGTRKELGIRTVKASLSSETEIAVYPNPTNDVVKISFAKGKFTTASLVDLSGKTLRKKTINHLQGDLEFDMSNLASAIYMLKLEGQEKTVSKQIIKN